MLISNTAIRKPVTTILLTCVALIFGYFAFSNLGVDLFPEVELPTITVIAVLPGADPEIIDSEVTEILEEQINTIEGVKTIISNSREGQAQIVAEFVMSKNIDVAAQEVRDKVNVARVELPRDLEAPLIQKLDIAAQPIMWVAVTSRGDYRRMSKYADEVLKEQLQTVPGVGAVVMGGFRDREIRLWVDPRKLEARQLTPVDIANAVRSKHVKLPGGRIEQTEKEFVVKVEGEYESVEELERLVIKGQSGALVRLTEVGRVVDGLEDLRSIARFNGLPAIGLGIRKQSGTNTVEVAEAVRESIRGGIESVPDGINVQVAFDSSRFIQNSMDGVIFDLFLGALLTSLVILIFLRNVRMTLISVLAVPTSIITSFVAMYALGFTINNMTMLAMSLAIGMVIDDAIVVLENIFRHVERREPAMTAARVGSSEVGLAVIATTLSVVAVFIPVAFMKGIIGRFFFQFGLSVALAVVISTLVALTLVPMLCSRLLGRQGPRTEGLFGRFERGFLWVEAFYRNLLDKALSQPWRTLGLASLVFVAGLCLVPFVDQEFVTEPDKSEFLVRFEFPTGSSVQKTAEGLRLIEKAVFEEPEVTGAFSGTGFTGGVNSGILFVNLVTSDQRDASQFEVMARLRGILKKAVPEAMIAVETSSVVGGGFRNADLQFIVKGPTVEQLSAVSEAMIERMRKTPGFVDVDSDLRLNKPEFKVSIRRDLADDLGVGAQAITQNFSMLFGGVDISKFTDAGKRYDIRLKADPESRATAEDLYRVVVRSATGQMIDASNLIQVEEGFGPNSINRYNRSRSVTLFANLDGVALGDALTAMNQIAEAEVPREQGWSTALSGSSDTFRESFRYLLYAIGVSLLLIYAILGSQFESFVHPFTILMSVPLSLAGAIGLLLLTGKPLDIFAFIGFIMLIGIVTKNAILLVDITNQLRERGLGLEEALREAGPLRLRPILMTALTTMAAVIPIALALSEGGEQRAPMAVAVIGGLLTSTFLTLLVVPCVYLQMDRFSKWVSGRLAGYVKSLPELPQVEEPETAGSLKVKP